MMRIIIGCDTRNEYVGQLARSLAMHEEVEEADSSLYKFWRRSDNVDLVHIQWPEALFSWKKADMLELARLGDKLDEWASKAKIVTTVHNYKPHTIERYELLYQLVYEQSDGIVHLGQASKDFFFDRYEIASDKRHAVIPHGNYSCFPNQVTPIEARPKMALKENDFVCLCFGYLRHSDERDLLVDGFAQLKHARKRLLVAGSHFPYPSKRKLQYWQLKYDSRLHIHDGWIPDEEVQFFLNAADVVVISRQGSLNSGNVALGFTFGRVVVGPDEGVIGEVLRETGNPVYEPGNPTSLAEALEQARELIPQRGEMNRAYALADMGWDNVAAGHLAFYQELMCKRS